MNEATYVAAIAGPGGAIAVLLLRGWLERRKNAAEVGLTIDQRWERLAEGVTDRLEAAEEEVSKLKERVTQLEEDLHTSQRQVSKLTGLLRTTLRWALTLRDEVMKAGGAVPAIPADVELALTTLELGQEQK